MALTALTKPRFKYEETEAFIVKELKEIYTEKTEEELFKWLVTAPKQTFLRVNANERKDILIGQVSH